MFKDAIKGKKRVKVIVIGETDAGKSTLIAKLATYTSNLGYKTSVIDMDIGQSSIGPPTTIGLGKVSGKIDKLDEIKPDALYFIGSISPQRHLLRCLVGLNKLLEIAKKESDIIFFDTTGWVHGGAATAYKTAKIDLIQPDIIITLERENEVEHIIKPYLNQSNLRIFREKISEEVKPRDRERRRIIREQKLRKYFENADTLSFSFEKVGFTYTPLGKGKELSQEDKEYLEKALSVKIVYGEKTKTSIFLVKEPGGYINKIVLETAKRLLNVQWIKIVDSGSEEGILVGLNNIYGLTAGLGIIRKIDYDSREIQIYTPVKEKIYQIQFGSIKVTPEWKEVYLS
ncbi:MAG: Clp1/GlmU family protein [Candidatus Odinarchaeia archaeon]